MKQLERFDEATIPQVRAANPRVSSWVSANAGSGKTRVLTNRVARLLLDGVSPQKILCITFTNAAASNMQNRLVEILGGWVMLPDDELAERLLNLGESAESLTTARLRQARTLFARALEAPSGMKIQTIHSFSAMLLRRYPLEAGISPQFVSIGELQERAHQFRILDELARSNPRIVDHVGRISSVDTLFSLVKEIVGHREKFSSQTTEQDIFDLFGVPEGWHDLSYQALFSSDGIEFLNDLSQSLREGSVTDDRAATKLSNLSPPYGEDDLNTLYGVFLFGKTASEPFAPKIGKFPTKATQKKLGMEMLDCLHLYMLDVCGVRQNMIAYTAANRTFACHQFAGHLLTRYEEIKRLHAFLDFDDMLIKARDLLADEEVSPWILYRLDSSIDHILVDEAQDVNPIQWEIVSRLAEEFTSGKGQHDDLPRTIFAVGDEKQSIFGFQGAVPERFREMHDHFKGRFEDAGSDFIETELAFSFRSSAAILNFVDGIFGPKNPGLFQDPIPALFEDYIRHRPFQANLPGRVDVWPFISKQEEEDRPDWSTGIFRPTKPKPHDLLARSVARSIKRMLDNGELLPEGDSSRPVTPGDILILVQRRSDIYRSIIRELKKHKLPVAGTDRLRLSEDLAVLDLLALLKFLSVPGDDLSLAASLKSPLFGISEEQLFDLSYGRKGSLWRSLKSVSQKTGEFLGIVNQIEELRAMVDYGNPYDILEHTLVNRGGRRKLTARLGDKSEEAIDALLEQALLYEKSESASLTGFLEWLQADEVNVSRQLEQASDEIRVMTVHGAKGLESPIVILPETGRRSLSTSNQLVFSSNGIPIWKMPADSSPNVVLEALDLEKNKEVLERLRLLYVALTRAECWLIVCGAGQKGKIEDAENPAELNYSCWYDLIHLAILALDTTPIDVARDFDGDFEGSDSGWRYSVGDWPDMSTEQQAPSIRESRELPSWSTTPVSRPSADRMTISPSELGGAKTIGGGRADEGDPLSLERGTLLHYLLEHLPDHPSESWETAGRDLLNRQQSDLDPEHLNEICNEARTILGSPELKFIFGPSSLAEVALTTKLEMLGEKPVFGYIDRLIVGDAKIIAVDFKSNRVIPDKKEDIPEGFLRQLGAYQLSLEKLYPDRPVETAILWTRAANLMQVPRSLAISALKQVEVDPN